MGSERSEEKLKTSEVKGGERISGIREYQKNVDCTSIRSRRCPRFKNTYLKHLGVSDVDFDPENGSRMAQLARGVIFAQIRALVQPLRDLIGVMISPLRHHDESE